MDYELQALSDELDEQNAALEAMLADMEYDDLAMEGSIDDLDEFLDDDEMEPAEESLFHKPKSVEKMLSIVQKRVRKKCKTVEACDDMLATLNQESQKFNDAMKQLKQAAVQYSEDGDKKALSHTVKPIVSGLKKSCDLLKLSDIADNAKNITDDDLQKLRDFISGATKIVKDHKASLSNVKEGYDGMSYEVYMDDFQEYEENPYLEALEAASNKKPGIITRIKEKFLEWIDRLIKWADGNNKKNKQHPKVRSIFGKFRDFLSGVKRQAQNPSATPETINDLQKKTVSEQTKVNAAVKSVESQSGGTSSGSSKPIALPGPTAIPLLTASSSTQVKSSRREIAQAKAAAAAAGSKNTNTVYGNDKKIKVIKPIKPGKSSSMVIGRNGFDDDDYLMTDEEIEAINANIKKKKRQEAAKKAAATRKMNKKFKDSGADEVGDFYENIFNQQYEDATDSMTILAYGNALRKLSIASESVSYEESLVLACEQAYVDLIDTISYFAMESYKEIGSNDMNYEMFAEEETLALPGPGVPGYKDPRGNIFKRAWTTLKTAVSNLWNKITGAFKKPEIPEDKKMSLKQCGGAVKKLMNKLNRAKTPEDLEEINTEFQRIHAKVKEAMAGKMAEIATATKESYISEMYDIAIESSLKEFNSAMEAYYQIEFLEEAAMEASVWGSNSKRGRRLRFGEESHGARKTYSAAKKAERKKDYEKAISLYQQAKKMFQALAKKAKSFPDNVGYTRDTRYKDQSGGKASALDWCLGMINMCEDAIDRINNKRMRGERRASEKAARAERKAAKRAAKESYGYNEYLDDDDDFYAMESDYDNDYDDFDGDDDDYAMESGLYDADFYMDGFDPDEF